VDSVTLSGDYSASFSFGSMTMRNVEVLELFGDADGNTYNLKINDGNVFTGDTLSVYATFMTSLDSIIFDGSAELDGTFVLFGGDGNDQLTGGWQQDTLLGGGGADRLAGGPQVDHYSYSAVSDSTGNRYDTVVGFDFDSTDFFQLGFIPSATDPAVTSGTLKSGHFNANLAAALDAAHLGAHHAVLFTPDSGTLAGKTFLVVDANGTAGYQANADFVIGLKSPVNIASFDVADFG
jgi:Ca2+-binding RTX toxin-like protein